VVFIAAVDGDPVAAGGVSESCTITVPSKTDDEARHSPPCAQGIPGQPCEHIAGERNDFSFSHNQVCRRFVRVQAVPGGTSGTASMGRRVQNVSFVKVGVPTSSLR